MTSRCRGYGYGVYCGPRRLLLFTVTARVARQNYFLFTVAVRVARLNEIFQNRINLNTT